MSEHCLQALDVAGHGQAHECVGLDLWSVGCLKSAPASSASDHRVGARGSRGAPLRTYRPRPADKHSERGADHSGPSRRQPGHLLRLGTARPGPTRVSVGSNVGDGTPVADASGCTRWIPGLPRRSDYTSSSSEVEDSRHRPGRGLGRHRGRRPDRDQERAGPLRAGRRAPFLDDPGPGPSTRAAMILSAARRRARASPSRPRPPSAGPSAAPAPLPDAGNELLPGPVGPAAGDAAVRRRRAVPRPDGRPPRRIARPNGPPPRRRHACRNEAPLTAPDDPRLRWLPDTATRGAGRPGRAAGGAWPARRSCSRSSSARPAASSTSSRWSRSAPT